MFCSAKTSQRTPASSPGTLFDRRQDALIGETVGEAGRYLFSRHDRPHEIGNGVHKAVLITDEVTWRPPMFDVGMRFFRHQDVAKTAPTFRIFAPVILESIHLL